MISPKTKVVGLGGHHVSHCGLAGGYGFSSYGLKQFLDKHVVMEGQEEPTLE